MLLPATPVPGETKPVTTGTSNAVATLAVETPQYIVTSDAATTGVVFVRPAATLGGAVAVVDADYPVLPNTSQTFTKANGDLFVGCIMATGSGKVWISPVGGK